MARIIIASPADADTDGILTDLAGKAGFRVALKFDALFGALYRRLEDHPAIGAPRPRLGFDIRIGIVTPYIVIYRYDVSDDVVTVLRIVHGRRRITSQLLRPGVKR
jgi:toxin ParE1/3/4